MNFLFILLQVLDDPCGNSFIENPLAPSPDPVLSIKYYTRTEEQETELGIKRDPPNESVWYTVYRKILENICFGDFTSN